MKSWYDLTKAKQKELKKEFNYKRKMVDLRIPLYLLSIIMFLPCLLIFIIYMSGTYDSQACTKVIITFGPLFIIFISLSIINSVLISKHQDEFKSWLKVKKIEK